METETIQVDLTDEEFLHIAKLAHEQDITFNQMVAKILEQHILEQEQQNDKNRSNT
jgi:predicted DNA-binding ribbon-helix-helix protein